MSKRDQRGVRNYNTKLSEEAVESIRSDTSRQVDIAEKHGISQAHVSDIKSGKRWNLVDK